MIGHAFVSSALFFSLGVLYDRYHTRLLRYYGGLVQTMPIFASLFFIFTIANMGFPGTSNFIGELLVFLSIAIMQSVTKPFSILFLAGFSIVLSAIYSVWLFNRIFFGTLKGNLITQYSDLTFVEFIFLIIMLLMVFLFGVNSDLILK
jgi:NADH-quinone oxidoreductase subunit M